MVNNLLSLGVALIMLSGCGVTTSGEGATSQLKVRERQTCTFDSCDVKTTMKAMIMSCKMRASL